MNADPSVPNAVLAKQAQAKAACEFYLKVKSTVDYEIEEYADLLRSTQNPDDPTDS